MAIKIITTGGTIDKKYNFLIQKISLGETRIPQILNNGRCTVKLSLEKIFSKYSGQIKKSDLQNITKLCKDSKERQIIITHGTDKMVDTAKALGQQDIDKTIVLTGAIIPDVVEKSDASFNLGGAIVAVQILPAGVYIIMNGKVFSWNEVRKDRKKKEFIKV